MSSDKIKIPAGPDPVLISRKQVDALYETLEDVTKALHDLNVEYIVTGGSLLGAIRQHSLLFCDDDIDIAIIDYSHCHTNTSSNGYINYEDEMSAYQKVSSQLQTLLGTEYIYTIKPWEGGDKVRPKKMSNIFLDIFVLRQYNTLNDLLEVIGIKTNGQPQPQSYIQNILNTIQKAAYSQGEMSALFPLWHFSTRKAIEMWSKEVYRVSELFPIQRNLCFGPLTGIFGPRMPVLLLKRAFGLDCFHVYYQSASHHTPSTIHSDTHNNDTITSNDHNLTSNSSNETLTITNPQSSISDTTNTLNGAYLKPLILDGGTWEGGKKMELQDYHYIPIQPISRSKRRFTLHGKDVLFQYIHEQSKKEEQWQHDELNTLISRFTIHNEQHFDHNGCTNASENGKHHSHTSSQLTTTLSHPHKDTIHDYKQSRPRKTIYMDGVFDLFHIGHLNAIQQCAKLGDRVIIGVTGQNDATGYKREPIISQEDRVAIVASLQYVDLVICPCPLEVTNEFMEEYDIDLVVHGFASKDDERNQYKFFHIPIECGKFQTIEYYKELSTTDIISKIQSMSL